MALLRLLPVNLVISLSLVSCQRAAASSPVTSNLTSLDSLSEERAEPADPIQICVGDLPQPDAFESASQSPKVILRSDPATLQVPPGFSAEILTTVNERDGLGGGFVPDSLTAVQPGGLYGWPYRYLGANPAPRLPSKPQLET